MEDHLGREPQGQPLGPSQPRRRRFVRVTPRPTGVARPPAWRGSAVVGVQVMWRLEVGGAVTGLVGAKA